MGADEKPQWRPELDMIVEKPVARGGLDKALLERAESIIDSFDSDDVVESMINLEALRGIVLGLWKRARNSSYYHQDILSTLENALLSKNDFTEEDMELFHETIQYLKNEHLVENHVKIISERFIYQDFSPLVFLSEIKKEKCVHCGARKLEADMLYVVALDEYFCCQEHFDEHYPEKGD